MKKLRGSLIVLAALSVPALAQIQQMTAEDQNRFDSYYAQWVHDRQSGDRDDMVSAEHHMQDLMNKYSIPASTPYDQVASPSAAAPAYDNRGYDNRGYDNNRYSSQWQGRLSPDDQNKFNKEYSKWQEANAKNDRDDIDKHARNMEQIMQRNNIPPDAPFDSIATVNGYNYHNDARQYQGRLSPDDQKKFDKAFEKWQSARARHDRDDVQKNEEKMQAIMARYNIPRDVPYQLLSSGSRGY
jgi:hypothetical protein